MTHVETVNDVYDWLPELHDISDDTIRRDTADALYDAPDYFWVAGSDSYYHPDEHGARHGLVLHTKRVASAFERFAPSMNQQGHMDDDQLDCARAACLLHDTFKYGEPPTETGSGAHGANDKIAADYYRKNHDLPSEVTDGIEAHKGGWGRGSPPTSHLQQMAHIADLMAATSHIRIGVKEPNEVLQEQFQGLRSR